MELLRLWVRAPVAILWTFAVWMVRLSFWPVSYISEPLDRRWRRGILRFWGAVYAPIIGMKVVVHGTPPKPPFYIVANHLSYMDIWLLDYTLGCAFVARGDMEHWPVIGFMSKSLQVLFIDRESKKDAVRVNELIKHALEMGDGIAIFAESRISRGLDVEPFKSALIQPAIENNIGVHYATISYKTLPGCPPANKMVGWWRPEPFFYHLFRLMRYRGFTAMIHFGEAPIVSDDRKKLASLLHAAVREKFVAVE